LAVSKYVGFLRWSRSAKPTQTWITSVRSSKQFNGSVPSRGMPVASRGTGPSVSGEPLSSWGNETSAKKIRGLAVPAACTIGPADSSSVRLRPDVSTSRSFTTPGESVS
jgi:hypothetical protein